MAFSYQDKAIGEKPVLPEWCPMQKFTKELSGVEISTKRKKFSGWKGTGSAKKRRGGGGGRVRRSLT
jgi:hypothetical protein